MEGLESELIRSASTPGQLHSLVRRVGGRESGCESGLLHLLAVSRIDPLRNEEVYSAEVTPV